MRRTDPTLTLVAGLLSLVGTVLILAVLRKDRPARDKGRGDDNRDDGDSGGAQ